VSVLNVKLRRDLIRARGMLGAVVAISAVGVACLVGMMGTYVNLEEARADFFSRCQMGDFWITLKQAPAAEVGRLDSLPGVSRLRYRITFPAMVDRIGGVEPVRPVGALVVSMPDARRAVLDDMVMRQGSYFTDRRDNEAIVSERFARAHGLVPGDTADLILSGERRTLHVVGTAIAAEYTYLTPPGAIAPDPEIYGAFWIKRSYAEDAFDLHGACNSVVGSVSPAFKRDPRPVMNALADRLAPFGVLTRTPLGNQQSAMTLDTEIGGLRQIAFALPTIFLAVSALVLNVLMVRLSEQQRTVIGTLKALGVPGRAVFEHFVAYGLVVGLIGGVVGSGIGYLFAGMMTDMYQTFFNFPDLANRFHPDLCAFGVLVSVGSAVLGTLYGVRQILRLNVAEAMRTSPPESSHRLLLERWRALWTRLAFRWQLTLRNLLRNRVRTAIGLVAAAFGAALVFAALGMSSSLHHMIDFQFDSVIKSDYELVFHDPADISAVDEARRLPGMYDAEGTLDLEGEASFGAARKQTVISGLEPDAALIVPHDANEQRLRIPTHGVLVPNRLAGQLGLSVGDVFRFTPSRGDQHEHDVFVAGIADRGFGTQTMYATRGYLDALLGQEGAVTSVQLRGRPPDGQRDEFYARVRESPVVATFSDIGRQRGQLDHELIEKLGSMTQVMVVFAGVIFLGSILNGALMSIAERRRELATYRVLGYHPRETGAMLFREIIIVNMAGAVLGLPLGVRLLHGIAHKIANDLYRLIVHVSPQTGVLTIVLAFLFVVVAYRIAYSVVLRLNVLDALGVKE